MPCKPRWTALWVAWCALGQPVAWAVDLPACLSRAPDQPTSAAVPSALTERELLARLVLAESVSTGFGEDALVHRAIAWGVMNRVRLAERSAAAARSYGRGVRGVVFQPSQFNPAVSVRSPFAAHFLCPSDAAGWALAWAAAGEALAGEGNPFVQTAWEQAHGVSLVVNFYYPGSVQARGPLAPWEGSTNLRFLGDLPFGGETLPASRVRFYRLSAAPADLR